MFTDGGGLSGDMVTDGTYLYGVGDSSIFRLGLPGTSVAGSYSVLYTFSQQNANLGVDPNSIIIGRDGKFYGTTLDGGGYYCGVVFCFDGTNYTVLHNFNGGSLQDGYYTFNNLVQSKNDGYLYGVTAWGGKFNEGTLYRLDTSGNNFGLIHSFGNSWNGNNSGGGITSANVDGAFPVGINEIGSLMYGATMHGGNSILVTHVSPILWAVC